MGWGKKRKSGAYEVVSRAETDDGYVTSKEPIVRNENSCDLWLQAAAKRLKIQISNSDMLAADVFYYKTCYDRFVYFYRKIPKENSLLNKEVSNQFSEKEFLVLMKLLSSIWPSCWTVTIVWNVLHQWKHQVQQKDEIFSPRKL